jgi:hypothetical protein
MNRCPQLSAPLLTRLLSQKFSTALRERRPAGLGDHFGGTLMPAWSRIIASVARPLSDRL